MPQSVSLYPPRPPVSHQESEKWDDKPITSEKSLPHSIRKTETKPYKAFLQRCTAITFSETQVRLHSAVVNLLAHSSISTKASVIM